jgi:hypothetical protein
MSASFVSFARHPAYNFVASQLGWLLCVVSAAKLRPELGAAFALTVIGIHVYAARAPRAEAMLLMFAAVLGTLFDSLLVSAGWLRYPSGMFLNGVAPYWIIMMWPLFSTTLNISMAWMKGRLAVAALMGAVFGPLAYRAGSALGAVEFVQPAAAYPMLAAGWAVAMPLLVIAASRVDGATPLSIADERVGAGVSSRV